MFRSIIFFLLLQSSLPAQTTPDNWFTDLAAAKTFAETHNGSILMVFAGSDWCRPCIQLKKDLLTSTVFQAFAKNKIAVLYLDFPARKKNRLSKEQTTHNEALAEKYNRHGAFPKMILMDADESILIEPAFSKQSPDEFVSTLDHIQKLQP